MRKFNQRHNSPFKPCACILASFFIFIGSNSQTYTIDSLMRNGERHNRINFVYLSDGYLATEMSTFITNATNIQNLMFLQTPFAQYKNYFNTYAIRVPSLESGAKHPGTASDEASSGGQPVANPNNIFGSTFDFSSIHRLLVPQNASGINNTLANNFPDYTHALILVNSPFYGGSGGQFATSSADPSASEIAIHELGHSFAGLADEYWAGDIFAFERPNMTANSNPSTVKWQKWIGTNNIGVYPYGASGTPANWYRPHQACKMQFLGFPFCSVCNERFIDVFHLRVNMIDDYSPRTTSFTLTNKNDIDFSISVLQTIPSTVTIKWYLNESLVASSENRSVIALPFSLLNAGTNTVRAEVVDNTPLSRSYLPGIGYVRNLTWNVLVSAEALPVHLKSFSGKIKDDAALLNWEIDSPDDLQIFELERSIDGLHFTKLTSVTGQELKTNYHYIDKILLRPYAYYRLKIIEKSGLAHYSNIIRLQNPFDKFYYKVYQDAASHRYHLAMGLTAQQKVSFRITDIQGRVILQKDFGKIERQLDYDFDLAGKSPGIYFMTLFVNNSTYTVQLVAK
jgi:IgA Peptidase M64